MAEDKKKKKKKKKEKREDFVHLHVHSDMSQLDGCGKMGDYIDRCVEIGAPAIAFTEHGTMRGYHTAHVLAEEAGIKLIHGVEFYVANDMNRKGLTPDERDEIGKGLKAAERKAAIKAYEEREGIRDRWHLTVWAKNDEGLRNLYKLTSAAYLDGFYYKPRIDVAKLIEHGEGLMVATGCMSSVIYDRALAGKRKQAFAESDRLAERFGEDFWIEMQPHNMEEQSVANRFGLELYDRYGGKSGLLATQDAHYVKQSDACHHDVLLCIGTNGSMNDPNRWTFDNDEFFMKSRAQMMDSFLKYHGYMSKRLVKQSLDNTMLFAEKMTAKVVEDYHAALLPEVDIPKPYKNEWDYLKGLCFKGWEWRGIEKRVEAVAKKTGRSVGSVRDEYKRRMIHEMNQLKRQRFVGYLLMVHDIYHFARGARIMVGPGRGSIAGSLVAFLIGLSSVDPIEHGLIFERFINPNRVDMPDVDMDFEDARRHEIFQYLRDKYGEDRCAQIATIGKLSGKQCLKDVARVFDVPLREVNEVTGSIIERSSGDERASQTIEDSFRDFKVCREFDAKYPMVLKHAKCLEGMAKNVGIHAAGAVVSPEPMVNYLPLEVRKSGGEDVVVTALDMMGVAAMGLVKLDVLGLRTLTVLREAVEGVEKNHGIWVDLEALELNDKKVLDGFTNHDYGGIFQYDTASADKVCQGVKFEAFEDVAAMTALNRPGTARSGLASQYVARKKDPSKIKEASMHPKVSEITSDTLGIIVYQEHVIKIFTDIAGFAPGTADSLRKSIAKKKGDETIGKERKNFIEGAMKVTPDMTLAQAEKIIDAITFFGSYGFNKSIVSSTYVLRAGANAVTKSPWITIKDLVAARDSCDKDGSLTAIARKMRYRGIDIIQMDEDGRCRPGRMKRIHDHGVLETFQLKLEDGTMTPKMSINHKLFTPNGYKAIRTGLGVGDELVLMGVEPVVRKGREGQAKRSRGKTYIGHAGGMGTPSGSCNPGWIDGRAATLKEAKEIVKKRSGGVCEQCHAKNDARHEVAHIAPLEYFEGDYVAYNSVANLKYLCNSCHKVMDYYKGERVKRWSKGRPTYTSRILEIIATGEERCYDLEMDTPGHNFVATPDPDKYSPVVSHNSHATAYGVIAYWGMWLNPYYPLKFYCALLKNEPDRIAIQRIAKDAKTRGIKLLPPDVSVSQKHFAMDVEHYAIRGSLVDVKGVGETAANTIMENQPYDSFTDFAKRIDRRKCNRGTVKSLVSSGALSKLIPNVKWMLDNLDAVWGMVPKGKYKEIEEMLANSKSEEQFTEEEAQLMASSVSPLAFGKHPIDAYGKFMDRAVKIPIVDMSSEDFFKDYNNKSVYIAGVIVEVKYNQIGDFHTGALPSEEEMEAKGWGKRYANVNVEDKGGVQNRIKFDVDIFDDMRPLIDAGIGTPVIVHANVNGKFQNLRANFAVNLEQYRQKARGGEKLTLCERIIAGKHPAKKHKWSSDKKKKERITNAAFHKAPRGGTYCGVVTHLKTQKDKRNNEMAFFGVTGAKSHIEVICFGSNWPDAKKNIAIGALLEIAIEKKPDRSRGISYFYGGGGVRKLKTFTIA